MDPRGWQGRTGVRPRSERAPLEGKELAGGHRVERQAGDLRRAGKQRRSRTVEMIFQRPNVAVNVALARLFERIMKPAIAPLACASRSSLSTFSA